MPEYIIQTIIKISDEKDAALQKEADDLGFPFDTGVIDLIEMKLNQLLAYDDLARLTHTEK